VLPPLCPPAIRRSLISVSLARVRVLCAANGFFNSIKSAFDLDFCIIDLNCGSGEVSLARSLVSAPRWLTVVLCCGFGQICSHDLWICKDACPSGYRYIPG
jgi:hypothetical protein